VDITRRQQAEQALRESEEEFKALFNGSSEAIMLLNTNGVVVKANAAMCTRFGIALQNFVGRNPFDSLPPVLARSRRAHFHQTLKTGKSRHFEDERDGRVMETHMYPTKGPSGKVTGIAVLVRDITSLKQVEKTLRKSRDELEVKVRERTVRLRALATELTKVEQKERRRIAHILHEDLQQRLVAMQYRIGNLKEAVQIGPASQTADRLLEDLTEAIQLTRNLTVRLSPPILFELGLIAALDWLADDMQSQFGLVISIKGPRAVTLASDEMRAFAFEAVRELLMNANKHSGIKAAELRIKTSGKHRITIEVRDKGRGMAESQSGEGKFGLFSIRERAQALGGNLGVTSHPGKGTCAALTLPTL